MHTNFNNEFTNFTVLTTAEETPPLDFASPLPNLLQPDQMYFPGECMPCGSPEQFPSRAELREHRFVPDRTHARISQRTPFGRGWFTSFFKNLLRCLCDLVLYEW